MGLAEVIALLRQRCADVGSQAKWARDAGLSQTYVNEVLRGTRAPGKKLLDALGMIAVVDYRPRPISGRREDESPMPNELECGGLGRPRGSCDVGSQTTDDPVRRIMIEEVRGGWEWDAFGDDGRLCGGHASSLGDCLDSMRAHLRDQGVAP